MVDFNTRQAKLDAHELAACGDPYIAELLHSLAVYPALQDEHFVVNPVRRDLRGSLHIDSPPEADSNGGFTIHHDRHDAFPLDWQF